MKGVVFTELMQMIENMFGENMLDDVLDICNFEHGGSYTSAGVYDYKELLQMVSALSQATGVSVSDLINQYGQHLFFRFYELMPEFFEHPNNAFEFLETVHNTIHVEVKKLYPEAELPKFQTERNGEDHLTMVYTSRCPFADFAGGLINGCVDFYGENIKVQSEDVRQPGLFSRIFKLVRLP